MSDPASDDGQPPSTSTSYVHDANGSNGRFDFTAEVPAASSLGAAQYCIDRAVEYAGQRVTFGKPLSVNQAVQWPLVELQTEAQMVRLLVYYAAWELDRNHHLEVSDKVSMANYRANRLACEAADRAMQVHGGVGYSRHEPFEHIYRHHRRYRITEGAEEIQMRRVAQRLFKFGKPAR